jgi:putative transposase
MEIDKAVKEAIKKMALYHDWIIEQMESDRDHPRIFLSAPPRYSPAEIVKLIKNWTYSNVYEKYPQIKKFLWGGKMWCEGYYVSTVSDRSTKEEIKRYIETQKVRENQLRLGI